LILARKAGQPFSQSEVPFSLRNNIIPFSFLRLGQWNEVDQQFSKTLHVGDLDVWTHNMVISAGVQGTEDD